jgi:hypothetical protein
VAGLALLTVFALVEVRTPEPMLDLRILGNRLFRAANLQSAAGSAGFMGTLFLVPIFLQNGLGFSALHSGLSTFPEALGGMTGIQTAGRLVPAGRAAAADGGRAWLARWCPSR